MQRARFPSVASLCSFALLCVEQDRRHVRVRELGRAREERSKATTNRLGKILYTPHSTDLAQTEFLAKSIMGIPLGLVKRIETLMEDGYRLSTRSTRMQAYTSGSTQGAEEGQRDSASGTDSDTSGKLKILSEDVEDERNDDENGGGGGGGDDTITVVSEGDERDRRISELEQENMQLQDKILKLQSQLLEVRSK